MEALRADFLRSAYEPDRKTNTLAEYVEAANKLGLRIPEAFKTNISEIFCAALLQGHLFDNGNVVQSLLKTVKVLDEKTGETTEKHIWKRNRMTDSQSFSMHVLGKAKTAIDTLDAGIEGYIEAIKVCKKYNEATGIKPTQALLAVHKKYCPEIELTLSEMAQSLAAEIKKKYGILSIEGLNHDTGEINPSKELKVILNGREHYRDIGPGEIKYRINIPFLKAVKEYISEMQAMDRQMPTVMPTVASLLAREQATESE